MSIWINTLLRKWCTLGFLLGTSFSSFADDPKLKKLDIEPIKISDSTSIAFNKVWDEILLRSGIPVLKVDVPHGRRRRSFTDGIIMMDCCTAMEWRNAEAEKKVQLFSNVFHTTSENFIFRKGVALDVRSPLALKQLRFALVRDFTYVDAHLFGPTMLVGNINDVLTMIDLGRAQTGIISSHDFSLHQLSNPRNLVLGPRYSSAELRVRVHERGKNLLPYINRSIAELKAENAIDRLIEEAINQTDQPLMIEIVDTPGYAEASKAIFEAAGIDVKPVQIQHQRRYRRQFIDGIISFECCVSEEWRQDPPEQKIQVFSDVVYASEERYIFPKGKVVEITDAKQLSSLKFATVRGFSYPFEKHLNKKIEASNIRDMLLLVAAGRADVAILSKELFHKLMLKKPLKLEMGAINTIIERRIRVHKSKENLLPQINAAIKSLKEANKLNQIIETASK